MITNLVSSIEIGKNNQGKHYSVWSDLTGKKYKKAIGPKHWPVSDETNTRKHFREDSNSLNGRRLLFIVDGGFRSIPFVVNVKYHSGTTLEVCHASKMKETINLKNEKYEDKLVIYGYDFQPSRNPTVNSLV